MGLRDIESKDYFSENIYFADTFNYLVYDGEKVIDPEHLRELDTTAITIPYGNNARVPVQKYRDIFKLWDAMMCDDVIYVLLGGELQDKIHYAMPVKDGLYDMIGYANQVASIKKSYRKKKTEQGGAGERDEQGEITVKNGVVRIRLTEEEFLSGLRKDDKLIPIITAVVYLGAEPWDGPRSLFDMLDVQDRRLYRCLNDYRLNLISPVEMDDSEFDKFSTELGFAMKVLKYQSEGADKIIMQSGQNISPATAHFLNNTMHLQLDIRARKGVVNMCRAMEKNNLKNRIIGAIEARKEDGWSDDDIVAKILKSYKEVKADYVRNLMKELAAG